MDNYPLLSILIPTKNREIYALNVIKHILEINDNRFQLIIQDNSDTNKLEGLLAEIIADSRLKYFYHNEVLSFVDNFSFGISNCIGEYVTIIGDDDGINGEILDIVSWAKTNGINAITPSLPLIYYWPLSGVYKANDNGILTIFDISSKARISNPKKEVIKLLENGCQDYLTFDMAKVYHGVVKREFLEQIKDITGKYIGGLSPDIYLSVAVSELLDKVLIIDYPLTISGICNKSGSSDVATGKHTGGRLKDAPHFRGHSNYGWSEKVPEFYCAETIWADSALAAITDINPIKTSRFFNVDVLCSFLLKRHPRFKKEIFSKLSSYYHGNDLIIPYYHIFKGYIFWVFRTIPKKVILKIFRNGKIHTFRNVDDISEASRLIKIHLRNKKILLTRNLKKIYVNQ